MKWIILTCTLGSDLLILTAWVVVCIAHPCLGILLGIPTLYAWKSTGGFSNWRISYIKSFLKNWNNLVD